MDRQMHPDDFPRSEPCGHVDFGGYFLTHAIWRNSYGSYQPETGVRTYANNLKDFRLIQHNSDDWPMVTVVTLAGLSKGWDAYRIGNLIEWLHNRNRRKVTRARFRKMHDDLVSAITQ
jgi:hypothetical protein